MSKPRICSSGRLFFIDKSTENDEDAVESVPVSDGDCGDGIDREDIEDTGEDCDGADGGDGADVSDCDTLVSGRDFVSAGCTARDDLEA